MSEDQNLNLEKYAILVSQGSMNISKGQRTLVTSANHQGMGFKMK